MEFVYLNDGQRYGGQDVGLGGETYPVRREGTRDLINVPQHVGRHTAEDLLAAHGWVPVGKATEISVERAAQAAIRKNNEENIAKQVAALEAKPEETSQVRKGH